jgi:Zn-dependent peptidase ImmA (M78 family)/DNA-binding XRE family transcriptional regulator
MNSEFNPDMLSLARDIRGIKQEDLANKAGLTQGAISKYLGGSQTPSDEDVQKLATALDFPASFLYRYGKRRGTLDGHIFHRKKAKASVKDIRRIDGHLEIFQFQTGDLLSDLEIEPLFSIPQLDIGDYHGDAEQVAEAVRTLWKMPKGPVNNLIQSLEAAGCFVYMFNFGTDDIDENVQWIPPNPPVILANSRASGDRLRFSLAHALGHLVMHQDEVPHKNREKEADQFAGAFLMPADSIREYISPITLNRLVELKPYWKVSIASMIMRVHQIGEITDRRKRTLFQMLSKSGWRTSEPSPIEPEKPQLIYDLIKMYRKHLSYGDKDLAKKLRLFPHDFRRMYYPNNPELKIV